MAAGIVYLDVDDEITSAASRIRSSTATRVALVVPYGSRIATSRMNFRLLSREALVSNRRLSIVAGDAASRSLAASAGLPVFASVSEYETAEAAAGAPGAPRARDAHPGDTAGGEDAERPVATTLAESATIAAVGGAVGAASGGPTAPTAAEGVAIPMAEAGTTDGAAAAGPDSVAAGPDTTAAAAAGGGGAIGAATVRSRRRTKQPPAEPPSAETTRIAVPAAIAPGAAAVDADRPAGAVGGAAETMHSGPSAPAREISSRSPAPREDAAIGEAGGRSRTPLLVALALGGLALIVLAVGAYLLVPSASIAVMPRVEPISTTLTVSADPNASAVDPATATIPADRLDVPVEASQTFTTTGVHVEQSVATGSVVFTNYNPTASNAIARGSIVSTEGGIRFRTLASVTIPRASFTPPTTTIPSTRSVAVEALVPGTAGNVPANAIRVVPAGESPLFLQVNNPQPTSGGTHTETPQVTKAELDKALTQLQTQLESQFQDAVANGAGAPSGTTVFPDTAVLGPSTPSPEPRTLIGQAVSSYDLSLAANGSVIAVDPSPVQALAEEQLKGKVGSDHRLVDGSTQVEVGAGTVGEDGQVTFQATATANRVLLVDPTKLRSLVKGKTKAEAEAALAPFGTARVDLWPDWVTTVTGVDGRLDVRIDDATSGVQPSGSGGSPPSSGPPSPAPRASRSPNASGRSAPSSRAVGSGSSAPSPS